MPTTQLAAHTPRPSEARTVEKRTSVATQAFKFGPSYSTIKFSIYTCLATQPQPLAATLSLYPR